MYENIVDKINNQEWVAAVKAISEEMSKDIFDEELAVLAGTVLLAVGKTEKAREVITKGLAINYRNYELWLTLGQSYEITNINQAYLCYENALLYCENPVDAEIIKGFINCVRQVEGFLVQNVSIVILSYNSLYYTKECIESIRSTCLEASYEIIVVDNASSDGSIDWLRQQKDIKLLCNAENVGFPKGCNQGIDLAEKNNDIFLLNNDAILTPNALFWLRMGLYENESIGATGARSNYVSNFQSVDWECSTKEDFFEAAKLNNLPMKYPYEQKIYLVGFALLIARNALINIGYLDEIFTPGTFEDNDLGLRLNNHGYKVMLCKNSFIYHYGSGGGKNAEKWNDLATTNSRKLSQKCGFNILNYHQIRIGIVNKIKANREAGLKILEIGCGLGETLLALKNRFPNASLYGVENDLNIVKYIPNNIEVKQFDFEIGEVPYPDEFFDLIIIGNEYDICTNTVDMLIRVGRCLDKNGLLVTDNHHLKKSDIALLSTRESKIAMCLYTHNHKETIEYLMPNICLNYLLHGIDVYVMDSSEDDETKQIVHKWSEKGFNNLVYRERKGYTISDKLIETFGNEEFVDKYEYIWPCKDRTIWPDFTLDAVLDNMNHQDLIYLEVRGDEKLPEKNEYSDGIELYRKHSLGLTSLDTTIFRAKTFGGDRETIRELVSINKSFPLFCYSLYVAERKKDAKICVLQGKRVTLYNINLSSSSWEASTFEIWKDRWVAANESLPSCYSPYREQVIKFVASQPWLLGGVERLIELKKKKVLIPQKLDEIEKNWEKVSDIPFEYVRHLAESKE